MDIVTPLHLHYLKLIIFILLQTLQLIDDPIESQARAFVKVKRGLSSLIKFLLITSS